MPRKTKEQTEQNSKTKEHNKIAEQKEQSKQNVITEGQNKNKTKEQNKKQQNKTAN